MIHGKAQVYGKVSGDKKVFGDTIIEKKFRNVKVGDIGSWGRERIQEKIEELKVKIKEAVNNHFKS
jgi:hypothetical protein